MQKFIYVLLVGLIFILYLGCTEKYPSDSTEAPPVLAQNNCAGCHLDKELLQKVADPLPPDDGDDSGEG